MTIQEIVRAAAELNISYGEYVRRYSPPQPPTTKQASRICKNCGREIVGRRPTAKYCIVCADERVLDQFAVRKHRGGKRHV